MNIPSRTIACIGAGLASAAALLLGACASVNAPPPGPDILYAVTDANRLIRFNASRPAALDANLAISGLAPGERLLGIDFRPANGRLYAAGSSGMLYTLDTASGAAMAVGGNGLASVIKGDEIGFDFNPVVDRIRVVDNAGNNLRLHPDTGAVVDGNAAMPGVQPDTPLAYSREDANHGKLARVVAVAYTNASGAQGTTNFAIDSAQATLVTLGRPEGTTPAKTPSNPNEGQLFTVGRLGFMTGTRVSFDIHPARRSAYASFQEQDTAVLYAINLASGAAQRIDRIGNGLVLRGIAIAP